VSFSGSAQAFCRTTTCDPDVSCQDDPEECCVFDEHQCDINGKPVSWPTSCVSYNTHEAGSELRGISQEQLSSVLAASFDSWLSVTCSGEPLSLSIEDRGRSDCGAPEFTPDSKGSNANVWMFQDDAQQSGSIEPEDGGFDASSLAISLITYDFDSAELVDVDVEFNSAAAPFTVGDNNVYIDLQSVATHEAGHFLGLEHSIEPGATMKAHYGSGDIAPRSLTKDDEDAICAVYPPDRELPPSAATCEPYGSYSPHCYEDKGCGCKTAGGTERSRSGTWLGLGLVSFALLRRRWRRASALRAD
jgi:hypothetical protein